MKFPPSIKHRGERPSEDAIPLVIYAATHNLRVPPAARRLMLYYANQANGFRPAMSVIATETSIRANHITTYRQILMNKGLIGYDGSVVLLDWVRIKAFAAITAQLMGRPSMWKITPIDTSNCYEIVKTGVHNYKEREVSAADRKWIQAYEATAEAVSSGIEFPELRCTGQDSLLELLDYTKTQVHNYRVPEILAAWFNPFDLPDPDWVMQEAIVDAYGEIVAYAHYNTVLPF